jgi:hypothetical protein
VRRPRDDKGKVGDKESEFGDLTNLVTSEFLEVAG